MNEQEINELNDEEFNEFVHDLLVAYIKQQLEQGK